MTFRHFITRSSYFILMNLAIRIQSRYLSLTYDDNTIFVLMLRLNLYLFKNSFYVIEFVVDYYSMCGQIGIGKWYTTNTHTHTHCHNGKLAIDCFRFVSYLTRACKGKFKWNGIRSVQVNEWLSLAKCDPSNKSLTTNVKLNSLRWHEEYTSDGKKTKFIGPQSTVAPMNIPAIAISQIFIPLNPKKLLLDMDILLYFHACRAQFFSCSCRSAFMCAHASLNVTI